MKRTQIYLPKKLHEDLRLLADREDISMAELIRKNMEKFVKKNKISQAKYDLLAFFADPPKEYLITKKLKKSTVELVREERD